MKRQLTARFISLITTLFVSTILCIIATAAEIPSIYVDQEYGRDTNTGSIKSPFSSINQAIDYYVSNKYKSGKIILNSDYTVEKETSYYETDHTDTQIEISGTRTSKLIFEQNTTYYLNGQTTFKDINIYTRGNACFVAGFNSIIFDTGVNVSSENESHDITVIGGFKEYKEGFKTNLDSKITINSGSFNQLIGFTMHKGDASVAFTGTSYINLNNCHVEKIICASADSHHSGNTEIYVYNSTVNELYTGGNATRTLNGNATLHIKESVVDNLYVNNVTGDVNVKLESGKIDLFELRYANQNIENNALSSNISVEYNRDFFDKAIKTFYESAKKYNKHITLHNFSDDSFDSESKTEVDIEVASQNTTQFHTEASYDDIIDEFKGFKFIFITIILVTATIPLLVIIRFHNKTKKET